MIVQLYDHLWPEQEDAGVVRVEGLAGRHHLGQVVVALRQARHGRHEPAVAQRPLVTTQYPPLYILPWLGHLVDIHPVGAGHEEVRPPAELPRPHPPGHVTISMQYPPLLISQYPPLPHLISSEAGAE